MSEDTEESNVPFPTLVADGVHTHFMEGFVAMLFYQDKVYPVYQSGKTESKTKFRTQRYTLFDVRLSIESLKQLTGQLEEGVQFYNSLPLIEDGRDFWAGISRNHVGE